MTRELARTVWEQAGGRCEYCLLPQSAFPLPFQIDHILAEKHGGETVAHNLALACPHCNRHKGPNIAGFDSESDELVRLFDPRRDVWLEHFRYDGARAMGKTPIGRVTVHVLAMNAPDPVRIRIALLEEGILLV